MTIALEIPKADNSQRLSLDDYLAYNDGTDTRYELLEGVLTPMSVGTGQHGAVMEFINDEFRDQLKKQGLPWTSKQAAIAVQSPRGRRWDTCRIPDCCFPARTVEFFAKSGFCDCPRSKVTDFSRRSR